MAIRGVLHVGLTVADADRSIAFYRENFGFELLSERVAERGWVERRSVSPTSGCGSSTCTATARTSSCSNTRARAAPARARGFNDAGSAHLCFVTDDIDADVARLLAGGAERINADRRRSSAARTTAAG